MLLLFDCVVSFVRALLSGEFIYLWTELPLTMERMPHAKSNEGDEIGAYLNLFLDF